MPLSSPGAPVLTVREEVGEVVPSSRPIGDYGLLADGNSAALVARGGSIDWLCLPRFDSPAVFARILDPDAGHWSLRPAEAYRSERRYVPGTLVLETVFTTVAGTTRVRDALAFGEGERVHDIGLDSPHELLRLVEGLSGSVDVAMELAPRPEYGLVRPVFRRIKDGGRTLGGPCQIVVRAGVPVTIEEATMRASFRVDAGARVGFALRWAAVAGSPPVACAPNRVPVRIADTVKGWQSWERAHDVYRGAHRDLVRMSARVLKGFAYRPTGAIVAAPTTSLPETVGGERNWDYRYAWVRDASLTLEALYIGACSKEAEHFVSFVTSAAGGHVRAEDPLQIMYGIGGEHDLTERELPHLRGWRGSRPVRVGNDAWGQTQLDVYGELLNALHLYQEQLGALPSETQRFIAYLADAAVRRWRERDAGMWEMRGEPRHHLSSKVACWAGLDRAVDLVPRLGIYGRGDVWAAERDRIREAIPSSAGGARRGRRTPSPSTPTS